MAQCRSALTQWYETMIPALLPMMLLSSVLVDNGFAQKIGRILNKTLLRLYAISDNGCYCLITGLLCGFPMGAKTTADMLASGKISRKEANYLLCFINCIGPMYTINLTHVLFPEHRLWTLLVGLYGLPLCYGLLLRYLPSGKGKARAHATRTSSESVAAMSAPGTCVNPNPRTLTLTDALYESVPKCGRSILMLGGYMILFQTFFVTLDELLAYLHIHTTTLHPLVEITGGMFLQTTEASLSQTTVHTLPISLSEILLWNTWGGLCCMLQTYSFIKPVGISMKSYVFHKTILALLAYLLGLVLHQI